MKLVDRLSGWRHRSTAGWNALEADGWIDQHGDDTAAELARVQIEPVDG